MNNQDTRLRFQVAFDESDGEGIVFFGNYFRLAHRALEAYLPLIGISWAEWFANPDWGVPLRHVEADYLRSLKPGDSYEVLIKVSEIGESSVHFDYEFRDLSGQPLTKLKTSHVFLSRKDRKKTSVPEAVRSRLKSAQTQS